MDWNANLWVPVVGAMATAAGGAIIVATTVFRDVLAEWGKRLVRRMRVTDRQYVNALDEVGDFHRIGERIRDLPYVDRVLIFKGQNGGGIPRPGHEYTVRCTFGWSTAIDAHPEKVFDAPFRVDSFYIDMLRRIIKVGVEYVATVDLPKASMLSAFYRREKVVAANLYFLMIDEGDASLRYVSVASLSGAFTEEQSNEIYVMVERLRGLCRNGADPGTALEMPRL